MKSVNPFFVSLLLGMTAIFLIIQLNATENNYNKFSFGLHGGAITSFTDIKENSVLPDADELAFGGGLMFNYHITPAFTLQSSFLYGEAKGISTSDNLRFEAELIHGALTANVSINKLLAPESKSNDWMNIYGFAGAGLLFYTSEKRDLTTGALLRYPYAGDEAGEYHNAFIMPFGMGINFRLVDRLDIGLKSSFFLAMIDELDAHVVDDSRKDMYNYTSLGLTFRFGSNTNSMDWSRPRHTMYPGDSRPVDALNGRVSALEEELRLIKEMDESELVDIKNDIKELFEGHEDLKQQNVQLYGALEDIAQQLIELEAREPQVVEVPRAPERPTVEQFYSVQIMAQRVDVPIHEVRSYLRIGFDIEKMFVDGWYKYYSGRFNDLEDAKLHMQRLWGQGVRDAFIVKYTNGRLTPR